MRGWYDSVNELDGYSGTPSSPAIPISSWGWAATTSRPSPATCWRDCRTWPSCVHGDEPRSTKATAARSDPTRGLARLLLCGSVLVPGDERCPVCGEPVASPERKLLTILFADLTGYTALAKTLDPEDVHAFLRPATWRCGWSSRTGSAGVMGDGFMALRRARHPRGRRGASGPRGGGLRDRVDAMNAERGTGIRIPAPDRRQHRRRPRRPRARRMGFR